MKQLTRWRPLSFFRRGLLRFGGVVLAGATLLTLALVVSGLMLSASAASAAPFRPPPRPTATATQPRSTPTPRPTATTAPSPTATAIATRVPTSTAHPGANTDGTDAAGSTQSHSADSLLWSSLIWGLGAVMAALLGFGVFIWLFTRRAARERQQPAFPDYARAPSRERLNQLYQRLPSRNVPQPPPTEEEWGAAETTLAEEDTAPPPWFTPAEVSWPSTPRPPQWLTDAGILKSGPLKDSAREPPPEAPEEP